MNPRIVIIVPLVAFLAASCSSDPTTFELDCEVGPHDINTEPTREHHYDAPQIAAVDPVRLEPGGSAELDLRTLVTDADTPFDRLTISITDSAHVTGSLQDDLATLHAAAGWEGTEQMRLRAEDPTGLSDERAFSVVVEAPQPAPARDCAILLRYNTAHGHADTVAFASEANDWDITSDLLTGPDEQGNFEIELLLPEGAYGYKFVRDSTDWIEDPTHPYHVWVAEHRNSLLIVPPCQGPLLEVAQIDADFDSGSVTWHLDVYDSPLPVGIDVSSVEVTVNWEPVDSRAITVIPSQITVALTDLVPDKYTLRASIADLDGHRSQVLWVPVWLEEEPFTWEDALMYFAFVDRFRNGDPGNDEPRPEVSAPLGNWNGGDWAGIAAAIEEGYFDDLGVNTLWISAPNDNPDGAVVGQPVSDEFSPMVSAYHAYFPQAARQVENHFGTLDDLKTLTRTAHRHGIRVLVDFVANHVFETHPYYTDAGPDDIHWDQPVCREIDWSQPTTCWFEPYLPDLNYQERPVVERTVSDALWWIDATDLDGFRLDAVKHMHHNLSLLLRARIDQLMAPSGLHFYLIGETFTGDWATDRPQALDELAQFVSPGELSGQFNFPIYWEIIRTLARRESGFLTFSKLDGVIEASETRFDPRSVMGTFLGNHDVVRFVSHARGDIEDLWGNGSQWQAYFEPPGQPGPSEPEPYRRLRLAMVLLLTLPEIPVLYYGDEIGLAGAGDPDNRRMFPWEAQLTTAQTDLFETVQRLGSLRSERPELRRGDRTTLSDGEVYVFVRSQDDRLSVIAINNTYDPRPIDVPVSSWLAEGTELIDALAGGATTVTSGRLQATVAGLDAVVYMSPPVPRE